MQNRHWILGAIALGLVTVAVVISMLVRPAPEPQLAPDMNVIQAQMEVGEFASARTGLLSLLEADEMDAEAHFRLGLVHFNLGEYEQAHTRFTRAMELDPERASAVHHNLGVLAYQVGDLETARAEFSAALAIDPDDADTRYQLGAAYLIQAYPADVLEPDPNLLSSAEAEFRRARELAPDKAEPLVGLANVAMLRNNMDEAIDLLEQAVGLRSTMGEALFALGRAYAIVGRVDEAEAVLREFLASDPPAMWAQQAELILGELNGD